MARMREITPKITALLLLALTGSGLGPLFPPPSFAITSPLIYDTMASTSFKVKSWLVIIVPNFAFNP